MSTVVTRHPHLVARHVGYAIAALINAALLWVINVAPGWQSVPFLTDQTPRVLEVLNISLALAVAVNIVYLVYDPAWFRALGDVATTAVGLAVLVRIWKVFPFDFGRYDFDATILARGLLVLVIAGAALGLFIQLITLLRRLAERVD